MTVAGVHCVSSQLLPFRSREAPLSELKLAAALPAEELSERRLGDGLIWIPAGFLNEQPQCSSLIIL